MNKLLNSNNFLKRAGLGVTSVIAGSAMSMCIVMAHAGDFTPIGATGGQYKFTVCEEPEAPILVLDPKKRGSGAVRDYNVQVARYNAYIAEVQSYMDCLTGEADRDLETLYKAVTVSLEERQQAMQEKSDNLRVILADGPVRGTKKIIPQGIPTLAGGESVSEEEGSEKERPDEGVIDE